MSEEGKNQDVREATAASSTVMTKKKWGPPTIEALGSIGEMTKGDQGSSGDADFGGTTT